MKLNLEDVTVGTRIRKQVGDISGLMQSMEERGQLQPILVGSGNKLIAGYRRLTAARKLGWETIEAYRATNLDDGLEKLKAERDENTQRLDLAPSEIVAAAEELEKLEKPEAEKRKQATQAKPGKGKVGEGKFPAPEKGRVADRIAAAFGISGKTYEKAKAVVRAAKSKSSLKGVVEEMDKTGKVDRAYKKVQRARRESEEKAAAESAPKTVRSELEKVCILRHCDMENLLTSFDGIDAIVTDPPYPKEYLPLYGRLAQLVAKVPTVAVMCGQSYLPEILEAMCGHLKYRWTLAYLTPGKAMRQWERKIDCAWKPILLFGEVTDYVFDTFKSDAPEKDHHDWGQSESGMADLIGRLTKPGQLVCDPFLGGGTTAVVAVRMGRRFVGCDIDSKCVEKTWTRLLSQK